MQPPVAGHSWLGVGALALPVAEAYDWCVQPHCGAVVLFSGTVRDHAVDDGGVVRTGVQHLTYEAYEEQVVPRFAAIEAEVRRRWPATGRVAILHRLGRMGVGESSVVVVVSSAHRPEAFEAARYAIDALKASAPIWKHEVWEGGEGWGTGAHEAVDPAAVPSARIGGGAC
ncbi:MAG: molybdenum cofactor biosynthesis protein MoaE [Ilumatobacteraceae bacterium]|nr:molybdenum cofactor biosynthesis protein MoaE [Ilumatobacter sp.]MCB9382019.1 molybdenum cofactor biosynthesis protein MoaE [Acidimicrobiaceae bacterium]MCO5329998.1 molybdenum cofactor biosynthesis protein MoaE [Ilumatobacteraceae bacterium]